jgi:hypothetical protein
MGEMTEMIMMGFLCQKCGTFIDMDAFGFPRCCDCCKVEEKVIPKKKKKKREKQQG